MIKKLIRYFAKRTHDVRIQLLCGTLHGCIDLYGISGTIMILNKARKMKQPSRKVVKPVNHNVTV